MIARASRVFPGVLVTMMLAAPAFAAPQADSTDTVRAGHSHSQEHKRPATAVQARLSKPKPVRTAAQSTPPKHRAAPHSAVTTVADETPAGKSAAEPGTAAFIDDNFTYHDTATGKPGWQQSGVASWYGGSRWQGHRTSSGERYDENGLTAAHATLPMGSKIRVKLHHSNREVVVTINDRPGTRTRIIDLSKGAAKALGIVSQGVAMVTLSPM